mmetsp:Transcript_112520/g.363389  ORF Transcript_112520/g.363389 Transcript_112520/m.363389 type:complete len:226 (-) Transcript_112520:833-1510(-)
MHQLELVLLFPGKGSQQLTLVVKAETPHGCRQVADAVGWLRRQLRATGVEDVNVTRARAHSKERPWCSRGGPSHCEARDLHCEGVLGTLSAAACAKVPLVQVVVRVGREERVTVGREDCGHARRPHAHSANRLVHRCVASKHGAVVAEHCIHLGASRPWCICRIGPHCEAKVPLVELGTEEGDAKRLPCLDVKTPHLVALARHYYLLPVRQEGCLLDREMVEEVG